MNEDEKSTYDELIYKTPSMEIVDKINSSNKDKIILTGVKKSGKTTTLKCLSNRSCNNSNMIIYIDYSNLSYISNLSSVEYGYYYELLFAKKILDFVKENYKDCYINLVFDDKYIQNEFETTC